MAKEALAVDRQLPHNADAERYVLGALLAGQRGADDAIDLLQPADFFLTSHRTIFDALLALRNRRAPIDYVSATRELQRVAKLEAAGGAAYVAGLGDGMPRVGNAAYHAKSIRETAHIRAVIAQVDRIRELAFEAVGPGDLLDDGIERLSAIARQVDEDHDEGTSYRDAGVRLLDALGMDPGTSLRVYTGVDDLDRTIGGFRPGELVLFTADTGVGKTLLAQQTRRRACRDGHHCLYASGEMLAPHLVSREIATEANVEHWKIRRDDWLSQEDFDRLTKAVAEECTMCKVLDGELSLSRIRRVARQMKKCDGLGLVVLDYDELIDAPGKDEFDQQRNLVRGAKSIAMELAIPVVMISQLRKVLQGEDGQRPTLQRLYGSGAKPKHASIVIYVDRKFVRDLKGDETAARVVVLKNRDGRLCAFDAKFNVQTLRFEGVLNPLEGPDELEQVTR